MCAGELTAVIGINGIGKSTLLRTLANLQASLNGQVLINSKPLNDYKPDILAKEISVVLTKAIVSKNLSVKEMVTLGRQPYSNWIGSLSKTDNQKINTALEMLDLHALAQTPCYELSDGQLQRVMIARALVQDTSIILLDEPTSHLDLNHKVQILKLLRSIAHETQKTILYTSHEIELSLQLCDKMLLLNNEENPYEKPSELVKHQAFENLFPKDTLVFDSSTGAFRVKK